jgi:outer membrane biosynthesis protein TonB
MSSALYIFRLVWPFLKELVLGGLTLKEGMRTQKKKVFLLFFVSGLIITLFLVIPKFYLLSQEHTKLQKSIEASNMHSMEKRIKELEEEATKRHPETPKVPQPSQENTTQEKTPEVEKANPPQDLPKKKPPKQRVKASKLPEETANIPEEKNDRKKDYVDFFKKYDE